MKRLKLADYGLSEPATNCVYFGGLSSLEELNLSGNKFVTLPYGISILPNLRLFRVQNCSNLLSISELPSSLEKLYADSCRSMARVCLPVQSKTNPILSLDGCGNLKEIQGMEGLSNHGWLFSPAAAMVCQIVARRVLLRHCARVVMGIRFTSMVLRCQIGLASLEKDVHYHFMYLKFSRAWFFGLLWIISVSWMVRLLLKLKATVLNCLEL